MELFWAELKRAWIQLIRYPMEAIGGIIVTTVVFYGLFLSAKYIAGPNLQFGDRLDTVIIGYILWTLSLFILTDIAGNLQQEAQTGTLEQVFLSPFGARRIFLTRAIADVLIQLVLIGAILSIIIVLTGSRLAFPPILLLPLITVLLGALGLAFTMGSLALLFKRVQQILGIFQFALLFVLSVPAETGSTTARLISIVLPMVPGAGVLRAIMARGEALNWSQLAIAFLNGAIYLAIGLSLFRIAERITKRRGKLGGY